jgi:hypothetical protein
MSKPQYLLNPKSGAVLACTDLLLRLGNGLVACKKDGTPLETYTVNDDEDVVESNFLLNPVSGALVPWSLLLARKEGLIPCNDRDHANRILLNLGKDELVQEPATVTSIGATVSATKDVQSTEKVDLDQEKIPGTETVGLADTAETIDETQQLTDEPEETAQEDGIELEELVEVVIPEHIDVMTNKKKIVKYVKDEFGENLDARVNITMLKEQAAMLYNESKQDDSKLDEVSML